MGNDRKQNYKYIFYNLTDDYDVYFNKWIVSVTFWMWHILLEMLRPKNT